MILQSIGRLNERPKFDSSNGKVTITYDHGEKCTTNPEKNATSRIVFSCENGPSQVRYRDVINYIDAKKSIRSFSVDTEKNTEKRRAGRKNLFNEIHDS